MWQCYLVCGLSNLLGVGQEFHKLALLPENYIVKWCLRWIAPMFTCKRITLWNISLCKKDTGKNPIICDQSITKGQTALHSDVNSFSKSLHVTCIMLLSSSKIFFYADLFVSLPINWAHSISWIRQIIFLEHMLSLAVGVWNQLILQTLIFFLRNFNSLTWVPQSKMTRLQGDSRLSGRHQKQIMKKQK